MASREVSCPAPAPPWRAKVGRGGDVQLVNEHGELVMLELEEHSRLILQAVNSHDMLIDAVERAVETMRALKAYFVTANRPIMANSVDLVMAYNQYVLAQATVTAQKGDVDG